MSLGDEVQNYYKRLVEKTDDLERAINEAADSLIARSLDLDEEIRTAGAVVIRMLRQQILPTVKKIADTLSMSDVLRDHRANWQTIDSRARSISGKLGDESNGIRAQVHWGGSAASAYGTSVKHQQEAVSGLSAAASTIQATLDAVAAGLETAGLTIIPGVTALILSLTATIISAASVVGLPASLAFLLTTCGALLASCAGIIAGFVNLENAQSNQANTVQRALAAQVEWPTPGTRDYNADHYVEWKPL
jgi:uncharacterized protein YukE